VGKSGVLEHKSEHVKIEEKLLMTFSLSIIIVKEDIFLIFFCYRCSYSLLQLPHITQN